MSQEFKQKTCFVICPIGHEKTEIRERSDKIYKYIITPILKEKGYTVERADKISKSGNIGKQIIEHLITDDLVIADLTGHNPNVLYELAIRHMTGKPFIHMIKQGEDIPFDLIQNRAIKLDLTDIESTENCKRDLSEQIGHLENSPNDLDNPITISVNLMSLNSSGNPIETQLAQTMSLLQDLRTVLKKQNSTIYGSIKSNHIETLNKLVDVTSKLDSIHPHQVLSPPDLDLDLEEDESFFVD